MGHIVLFPFMSKGHTIPIIHLAHLLHRRGLTITIITTHSNSPFIRQSLGDTTNATVIELPFPTNVPDLPPGTESTDQLPSMSLFLPFVNAIKLLQSPFELALESLPLVNCIISDGFLDWTQLSAEKFNIPRFVFYGMNSYAMTVSSAVLEDRPHAGLTSDDEPFIVPKFPWIKLTKNDLSPPFNDPDPKGPQFDFVVESQVSSSQSNGIIVNSFYEIDSIYVDYWNKVSNPKVFCVGPLCLSAPKVGTLQNTKWGKWLDQKLATQRPVLFVAFGTQAELSHSQLQEIAIGLDRSGVDFLWLVRSKEAALGDGFEEKVADRGLVVKEWVDQENILRHEGVRGFMSHCGWNSVLESICAMVPILAWPMMAEQHLNAKLVVDELGIGLRVGGHRNKLVGSEAVEEKVRELMVGEEGKEAGKKIQEVGEAARKAMEEGGPSWASMDSILRKLKEVK